MRLVLVSDFVDARATDVDLMTGEIAGGRRRWRRQVDWFRVTKQAVMARGGAARSRTVVVRGQTVATCQLESLKRRYAK
ncbi:MAG: hypothetical protein R3C56_08790 [Pirellulaceae bacterium]